MKVPERFCRHCKSPARGNPCWYYIVSPQGAAMGFDPPCVCDDSAAETWERIRRNRRRLMAWLGAIALAVVAGVYLMVGGQ